MSRKDKAVQNSVDDQTNSRKSHEKSNSNIIQRWGRKISELEIVKKIDPRDRFNDNCGDKDD